VPGVFQNRQSGVPEALGAALLFGLSAPVAKLLLGNVSQQLLAGLLYLGSGVGLSVVWLARRSDLPPDEASLRMSDAPALAAAIGFGGVLAPLLLLAGLNQTPASTASLLLNLETVFTALLAWMIFKEHVDRRIALGMLSIVCGGLILSSTATALVTNWIGPASIAAACLCWGIDNNATQKISAHDPVQIASLKGLTAGAVNAALAIVFGASWPDWRFIGAALLLGFFSYGVSLVLYIRGLRTLGTARTGNYFSLAPFIGTIVGIGLFKDRVTLSLLAAGFFMGLGLWLHLTERHSHRHIHEPQDHEHAHVHDEHHQHEHTPDDPPGEPHSHPHHHNRLEHSHPHYPDVHHRHGHEDKE